MGKISILVFIVVFSLMFCLNNWGLVIGYLKMLNILIYNFK